jgi:hypothetical protein
MRRRADHLRVGDPERERAIKLLGEHLTAGRLDVHEYDERCAQAAAARFGADLTALFKDLPSPRLDDLTASRPADRAPRPGGAGLLIGAAAIILVLGIVAKQVWLLPLLALVAAFWFTRRRY